MPQLDLTERLRVLQAGERATEDWFIQKVIPAYDALKADSSRSRSLSEVRESLSNAHATATDRDAQKKIRGSRRRPINFT